MNHFRHMQNLESVQQQYSFLHKYSEFDTGNSFERAWKQRGLKKLVQQVDGRWYHENGFLLCSLLLIWAQGDKHFDRLIDFFLMK